METKKTLVPTIIAIVTLVIVTIGAAYAYFAVNTSIKEFTTRTASATTPDLGNVALSSGINLSMDLTLSDMVQKDTDIAYYASSTGKTITPTTENIGVANVTGAGTFTCTYTLEIDDNENSLYDAFQTMSTKSSGQIVLIINDTEYDFNEANLFPKIISGTMTDITENSPKYITAQLKLVNKKEIDQNELASKNITISFNVVEDSFNCTATS